MIRSSFLTGIAAGSGSLPGAGGGGRGLFGSDIGVVSCPGEDGVAGAELVVALKRVVSRCERRASEDVDLGEIKSMLIPRIVHSADSNLNEYLIP